MKYIIIAPGDVYSVSNEFADRIEAATELARNIDNDMSDIIDTVRKYGKFVGSVFGTTDITTSCTRNVQSAENENNNGYGVKETFEVGDIVPYRNTRGNIKKAKITSFKTVPNGKVWFNGIDIETKAKVWYPLHISEKLIQ